MKVFLVRHLEPAGAAGLCYGRLDLPTTPAVLQRGAAAVKARVGEVGLCLSSPLRRCADLAAVAFGDCELDARLAELDFGDWEGRRWDDIDRAEFDVWAADCVHRAPPGGESWTALRERAEAFLADLRERPPERAAVVAHAGVIRACLSLVMGIPLPPTWRIGLPYGCVVTVELGRGRGEDRLLALSTDTARR
ncbi:MAG: histidine phosphatase family protein [Propionibacteriaceae bacterium]|jgi:alpha-ribazole phosphatase|nr:histidine phosphatase family protein [Propionibacteriaceae bacterium]